jgi:hypothetical protein
MNEQPQDTFVEATISAKLKEMARVAMLCDGQSHDVYVQHFSTLVDGTFPDGSPFRDQVLELARTYDYATRTERAEAQEEMARDGYCSHGLDPDCCPCGCGDIDLFDDEGYPDIAAMQQVEAEELFDNKG